MFAATMTDAYLAAEAVVDEMCGNDQGDRRNEKIQLVPVIGLLEKKHDDAGPKKQVWNQASVVFSVTMPEGIKSNNYGYQDHSQLKTQVIDDIDTQHRQTGHYQGKYGTMNGTCQRSGNTQRVVINP
jgi:hypothetical protein